METDFIKITGTGDTAFQMVLDIYLEAFPATERQTIDTVSERLNSGLYTLYACTENASVVSFAILYRFKNTPFVLLDYLATESEKRNDGLGSKLFNYMAAILEREGKHIVIEVEDPDLGDNRELRRRRLAFYLRLGAYRLSNVRYIMPSLDGTEPTPMLLLLAPPTATLLLNRSDTADLITKLYSEVYNKPADDKLLVGILDSLPATVSLLNS